jgi:cell division protein FtsN
MRILIAIMITFAGFCVVASNANAHPGRTDSSGGHTCRTNCEDWGLNYGEYHSHGGGSQEQSSQNLQRQFVQTATNVPKKINSNTPTRKPSPTITQSPTSTPTPTSVKKIQVKEPTSNKQTKDNIFIVILRKLFY